MAKKENRIKLQYSHRTLTENFVFCQAVLDTVFLFIAQYFLKRINTIKEVEHKRDILKVYPALELEFFPTTF